MEQEALWLFALVPPPDITKRIDDLRKEFAANFNCVSALKPPVHLTLFDPIKLMDADVEAQITHLQRWAGAESSFRLELKNFNFFDNPKSPVLYIDVVSNPDIKALKTGMNREMKKLFGLTDLGKKAFRPHVTLGYKDVSPEVFPQVKQAYGKRTFSAVFKADHISVFRHNRKSWVLHHELPLAAAQVAQTSLW